MLLRLSPSPANRPADFNPHSSCEERLYVVLKAAMYIIFQSTLLMRGATRSKGGIHLVLLISIHAPHARSDDRRDLHTVIHTTISIHAPHARSDTPPTMAAIGSSNFNPRSSCEERPVRAIFCARPAEISIHAPHARSDPRHDARVIISRISIHAPHTRSDA